MMNRDNIPPELAELERWLLRIGEKHAPPGWNNPENWRELDDIPENRDAIFNMADTTYLIIDGDHIIKDGAMLPEARELLKVCTGHTTYSEYSQSGTGVHIVYDLAEYIDEFDRMSGGNGPYNIYLKDDPDAHIEFYFKVAHLFRFTGHKMKKSADRITGGEDAAEVARQIVKLVESRQPAGKPGSPSHGWHTDENGLIPVGERHYWVVSKCAEYVNRIGDHAGTDSILAMVESEFLTCCADPDSVDMEDFRKRYKKTIEKYQANKKAETQDPAFYSYALKAWRAEHPGELFNPDTTPWGEVREAGERAKAAGWEPKKYQTTAEDGKVKPITDPAKEMKTAAIVEEQEAEWLIPGFIPRYQITTLAGDGGSGKTTIECAITASITTGKGCFMTSGVIPEDFTAEPENVLFLSAEDDFARVLKRKLRIAGADMERVYTLPISAESFSRVKFGSEELRKLIAACRPGLVIFDPIQAFVPPDIQMGWRNAMRQCLNPLIGFGENFGASFLIICHTNKQQGVYGRKRIAESADIWDISRSVLMVGDTGENGLKYMSHEKCNYGELQKTVLYALDGEQVLYRGQSDLKDADFVRKDKPSRQAPARKEAKELIIDTLTENGGQMKSADLDSVLVGQGVSGKTLERAKAELKDNGKIRYWKSGFSNSEWMTSLAQSKHGAE